MADFNSSLPVRTQSNGDVVANIADGTIETQLLAIDASGRVTTKMDDGNGNPVTSQANGAQRALDVGIDVAGVQIDPRQIRALTSTDVVTANNFPSPVDTNFGAVGASTIRVASEVGNATGAADFNFGTVGAQTLRTAAEVGNATGAANFNNGATGAQTLRVAANLAVAGTDVSNTNPVPVSLVSTTPGTAVQDYHTSASLAAAGTVTFTYTVAAAHTFNLERIWSSGSGKIKSEVKNNGSSIFVGFNSTANPNIDMTVVSPPTIAAGATVTVTITNEDKQAQDVYVTIEGNQN